MTDVSAGFRPPCWCPSRWAPAWRLHTNLYKFGKNVSPHIFRKKNCCDLNLGESLNTSTFFLFPDSRLNRLNGFYFFFILIYFEWRDTENQQLKTDRSSKETDFKHSNTTYSILTKLLTWLCYIFFVFHALFYSSLVSHFHFYM